MGHDERIARVAPEGTERRPTRIRDGFLEHPRLILMGSMRTVPDRYRILVSPALGLLSAICHLLDSPWPPPKSCAEQV